jgi:hypothetical protein
MGEAWLPGVQRVPNAKAEGGTYVADVPWRFVGHTTEVIPSSIAGAVSLAGRHEFPPHLWAWPERDWLVQTVRLDRSAFALRHPSGTPETNKMRALQVEVIGFAKDMEGKPDSFWDWIGEEVVRRLIDAGYAIDLTNIAPTTGGDGYGTGGAVRMSRAAWRSFDGLAVHANVPDNDHWDMGKADLKRVAAAAKPDPAPTPTPPPTSEDDDMPKPLLLRLTKKDPAVLYMSSARTVHWVKSPDALQGYKLDMRMNGLSDDVCVMTDIAAQDANLEALNDFVVNLPFIGDWPTLNGASTGVKEAWKGAHIPSEP